MEKRIKILFPPGIGDCYWSLVKLQAFLKQQGIMTKPDIYVTGRKDKKYFSHLRSFGFLEMFPFINCTWQVLDYDDWKGDPEFWQSVLVKPGQYISPDVFGCNWFMAYLSAINTGISLERADNLECNWYPEMTISTRQKEYQAISKTKFGQYMVLHFPTRGMFVYWLNQFSIDKLVEGINQLVKKTGIIPVFIGGTWDREDINYVNIMEQVSNYVDLIGQTTIEEMFGLLRGAQMTLCFPSGVCISSVLVGIKTFAIWNDYFSNETAWNIVSPDSCEKTYFIDNTRDLTIERLVRRSCEIERLHNV